MFPAGLFFLWNKWQVGIVMIIYAFTVNIIPIIVQRYNRPRLKRMLDVVRTKNIQEPVMIEI
jgi:glycosyl-4,4'-diaponeurosporenoate acyltransferase